MYGFSVSPSAAPRRPRSRRLEDLPARELRSTQGEERDDAADVERQKDDPPVVAEEGEVRDREEQPASPPRPRFEEADVGEREEERQDQLAPAELEVAPVLGRKAGRRERPGPGVDDPARAKEEVRGPEDDREEDHRRDLHRELRVCPEGERERGEQDVVAPVVVHRHVAQDGEREPARDVRDERAGGDVAGDGKVVVAVGRRLVIGRQRVERGRVSPAHERNDERAERRAETRHRVTVSEETQAGEVSTRSKSR